MTDPRAYSLMGPYRKKGLWLMSVDLDRTMPSGRAAVPGYHDQVRDVRTGRMPPFWGPEHRLSGGPIADLVHTTEHQDAVSERLRRLLEDAGAEGLTFHPIMVDGTTPMSIVAVKGIADADFDHDGVRLRDGAEAGLYAQANLYVSPRIAEMIRAAKLDVSLERTGLPYGARKP